MLKIELKKIIIECEHPYPDDFASHLKEALLLSLQNLDFQNGEPNHLEFINDNVSELLKAMIVEERVISSVD